MRATRADRNVGSLIRVTLEDTTSRVVGQDEVVIVWLAPSAFAPHRGGVEELTAQLAAGLQGRGHEVVVVTHRLPRDLPTHESVDGVQVCRVNFAAPGRTWAATADLRRAVRPVSGTLDRLPKPDLVHIQCSANQTAWLVAWAQLRRIPLIVTTQGETAMDATSIYQRSVWSRTSLRVASRGAAALTACSQWTAQHAGHIARRFTAAEVIPNGVRPSDWSGLPTVAEPIFAAWGRHVRQKGFDLLLDAFRLVREARPDARLLVGGAGPESEQLSADAGEGVEFFGSLDRQGVRELLRRARVGVVPSRIEPFGIVALEILASGRQLVYSDNTGLAEAAGGFGLAVDSSDPAAFSDALLRSLDVPLDPEAQEWVAQHSWEVITGLYLEVYERVLASKSSR